MFIGLANRPWTKGETLPPIVCSSDYVLDRVIVTINTASCVQAGSQKVNGPWVEKIYHKVKLPKNLHLIFGGFLL